jgi:hypothetical protein
MPRKTDRRKSPIAESFEPFCRKKVFYDLETWQVMFEDSVKGNPRVADQMSWLLYRVIREMAKGKRGRKRVVNTMKLGVEWLYSYTEARNASFTAFLYHLEGMLLSPFSVEEILKPAIKEAKRHHRRK